MDKIINIPTVRDYDEYWGMPTRHPLVNILEGSQVPGLMPNCRKNMGTYVVSANYFGDLIKKETGRTAQDYIQRKTMDVAKDRLADHSIPIGEIAYYLGYQYPQYFSRAFKKVVGCTPMEYRRRLLM